MTKEQFIALGLPEDMATKAAEASATELKAYVPKHRFDEINDEAKNLKSTIKANEEAIETLKKSTGDAEAIKKQIEVLQTENKEKEAKYQKELTDIKLSNAIKLGITGKVHDEDLVAGLFDKSKLILGEDGKVTGLDEQIKTMQEAKAFLFKQEQNNNQNQNQNNNNGFRVGGSGSNNSAGNQNNQPNSLKDAIAAAIGGKQ